MQRMAVAALVLACLVFAGVAHAQDKTITGTWKWTTMQGGNTRENTLKLKLDGDKLTGGVVGQNNTETAIEEATFKDGQVAFKVTRDRNGMKITTKYTGKLDGDTIKGKTETDRNGEVQSRDWEAKRAAN